MCFGNLVIKFTWSVFSVSLSPFSLSSYPSLSGSCSVSSLRTPSAESGLILVTGVSCLQVILVLSQIYLVAEPAGLGSVASSDPSLHLGSQLYNMLQLQAVTGVYSSPHPTLWRAGNEPWSFTQWAWDQSTIVRAGLLVSVISWQPYFKLPLHIPKSKSPASL